MEVEAYVSNRIQQLGLDSLTILAPTNKPLLNPWKTPRSTDKSE